MSISCCSDTDDLEKRPGSYLYVFSIQRKTKDAVEMRYSGLFVEIQFNIAYFLAFLFSQLQIVLIVCQRLRSALLRGV